LHYEFDRDRFLAPGKGAESGYGSFLRSLIDTADNCIFVAEQDGAVVGYVWGALEPLSWKELRGAAGFIHDIAVDEGARRLGLGTKLMDAAITWLREHGAPRVLLGTAAQNAGAQA